jgi:hypothetical protein
VQQTRITATQPDHEAKVAAEGTADKEDVPPPPEYTEIEAKHMKHPGRGCVCIPVFEHVALAIKKGAANVAGLFIRGRKPTKNDTN